MAVHLDDQRPPARRGIPDAVIALALALGFAAWLSVLGTRLFLEVDARVYNNFAVLPSVAVIITNYSAWALMPALILCAYFLREKSNGNDSGITGFFLNLLGMLLGCGIGWGLGVFLVPFDDTDGAIYSRIGAGVTTFLSGYVLSYLPQFIKEQLSSARRHTFLVQVGLGTVALVVTGLAVSTNRTEYLEFARLDRADEAVVDAREKEAIDAIKAKFECDRAALRNQRLARQTAATAQVLQYVKTKGHPAETGAVVHPADAPRPPADPCAVRPPVSRG